MSARTIAGVAIMGPGWLAPIALAILSGCLAVAALS
jgi:hypothetical protein